MNSSTTIDPLQRVETSLDLDNTSVAYKRLSNEDLKKENLLFRIFQSRFLVKFGSALALWMVNFPIVKKIIKNTIFKHFCGGENISEVLTTMNQMDRLHVKAVLDYAAEGQEEEESFELVKNEIIRNIQLSKTDDSVSFISLKVTGIANKEVLNKLNKKQELTPEERISWERTISRLDEICKTTAECKVVLYVDAEESWIQHPIDEITLEMMRKYNKSRALIFNTYQMYRTDRLQAIQEDINAAISEDFFAGIKIVRGAYLEKEREEARKNGYPSPVFDTKPDTDKNFNDAIRLCMSYIDVLDFCLATHNEASTLLLIELMSTKKINKNSHKVFFSQLYGMSDNITYNLADAGYNVSKYLPYGNVETAIPYLIRRAEENSSISGQLSRELQYTEREITRRKQTKLLS
jgi:proline dehydrogenase